MLIGVQDGKKDVGHHGKSGDGNRIADLNRRENGREIDVLPNGHAVRMRQFADARGNLGTTVGGWQRRIGSRGQDG